MKALTLEEVILKTSEKEIKPIGFVESKQLRDGRIIRMIEYICKCGKVDIVPLNRFISKLISCGCERKKKIIVRNTKYRNNNHLINLLYFSIKDRCYNPESRSFEYYGRRGVRMCDDWLNDYQKFLDWCLANGWKKGHQIDKDIKGNGLLYSPETCSFVSPAENMNNRRNTLRTIYKGKLMSIRDLSQQEGLPYTKIYNAFKYNPRKTPEEIISKLKRKI